ncbi:Protein CBG11437 [Caenorhabditis briggsae]|uniref:Protein CBG11437 n=2 Tax=Caenorhabditis briggsae TaxID=6238 RepID=A8XD09_CAEBR|nr:Protein CBG11437 [Caenorhabditis briggsae]ULT85886.1 hypothetical protein L3Y34_005933 [Caenorhabditis briggsae]CAP30527.2 Protein CBG11437 [Caenorhabditis briggsae]
MSSISAQTIFLNIGVTRIVSFHPKVEQESLEVTFSQRGGYSQINVYSLNAAGEIAQQTILFSDIVLMVQSVFECDDGFIGETCQDISTTFTTTTTTEETTTAATQGTTSSSELPTASAFTASVSTDIIICFSFSVFSVVLLILIVSMYLRRRQQHIYIQPHTPVKKTHIDLVDSGIYSTESNRYTGSPHLQC